MFSDQLQRRVWSNLWNRIDVVAAKQNAEVDEL